MFGLVERSVVTLGGLIGLPERGVVTTGITILGIDELLYFGVELLLYIPGPALLNRRFACLNHDII